MVDTDTYKKSQHTFYMQ